MNAIQLLKNEQRAARLNRPASLFDVHAGNLHHVHPSFPGARFPGDFRFLPATKHVPVDFVSFDRPRPSQARVATDHRGG
jgi:hypothetical protein